MVQNIRKRIGQRVVFGESRYMKRNGLDGRRQWMVQNVQNIRKRIGETVIYGVSGYMKRNGLDGRRQWRG